MMVRFPHITLDKTLPDPQVRSGLVLSDTATPRPYAGKKSKRTHARTWSKPA